MPDEATPTGKAQLLVNTRRVRLPVTKDVVINPVPKTFKTAIVKIVKGFIFLSNFSFSAILLAFA